LLDDGPELNAACQADALFLPILRLLDHAGG
jgi:hypothetical protein